MLWNCAVKRCRGARFFSFIGDKIEEINIRKKCNFRGLLLFFVNF